VSLGNQMLSFAHHYLESTCSSNAEDLVRRYADALLLAAGAYSFPVDLRLVQRRFELVSPYTIAGIGQRGFTTPDLRIILNADDPATIRKFTLAHEFMEIFFMALRDGAADEWMPDAMFTEMRKDRRKERLCDVGAAELAMPMEHFIHAMPEPVTLPWAQELAQKGQLSLTATLWRLLETGLVDAVLIVWRHALKPKETKARDSGQLSIFEGVEEMEPVKKLRVERVIAPPNFDKHVPLHKSVPLGSTITRAFLEQCYVSGRESLDLVGIKGEFWVESQPFRAAGQPLTISLVHLRDGTPE